MSVTEASIRAILDTIMDPCSVGLGCPLSLEAMGLVSRIEIGSDAITVMLRLTQPGCHFAALLQQEAEERIAAFARTRAVHVEITEDLTWSEA
ncbi:MAG TPA: iron-sulfur cluster assembly protein, partial [Ktedonobacterales bacterium]|nr:iron-sulfur cluster assembly protein [Ktedonobacterales bacterium]